MVEDSTLLHFVPRSLQLNMRKNNINEKPIKGSLKLIASDSKKKRGKEEEDAHAIEEDYPCKNSKKKKSELNMRSVGFYQLEDLIAEFLSSRGLSNTLSSFLSETQHEFTRKEQKVKLEDMYHYYCNKIYVSSRKENSAEGKVNREITFGKANVDVHIDMSEVNSKKKDNKVHPNGFSKAKAHASEIDFQRSKKSKSSFSEVVDNLSGLEDGKITEKVNKKVEPVIITHKSIVKLSNASNKLEQVIDIAEPFYKSKKSKRVKNKEPESDEMIVTDNDKQHGGKKSKKVTTIEDEVQPLKCHASHTQPKKGKTAHLRQDLENPISIEVSKKEKKKKRKTKSDATSPGDDGELGDTVVVITTDLRKSGVTDSNNAKRESKVESLQDFSVEPSTSPNFRVSKEKRIKSSQMAEADSKKKNKKVKKALEDLQIYK
ncbi:hypothetical protein SUGI_0581100 [Cryptomeria japonica]|uniref:uncharacterized protein LOC131048074 n=1 Tax=Cryptomeria japonica TaxID=3369 RepID=UPI002414A9E8|nr:uncharacterized protein LOC131048074 [Cryptomeria japonica]GLJ29481.1 hypothetical protein SUGI_0581100 [Cryptomeria japonica]